MGLHQNGSSWNPIIGVYGEVKCIVCTCLVCTSMCPLSPSVPAWSVPQCVRYHRLYLLGLYLTVPVIIVCTCLVCTLLCPLSLSPSVPAWSVPYCVRSSSVLAWSVPYCVRYHHLYLPGLYLTVSVIIVCTCLVCTLLCPLSSSVPAWSVLHCFPPLIFFNTFDSFLIFAQRIVCPFSVCDKICRQCAHFLITV